MADRNVDKRSSRDDGGKETESKKWPGYCKTIMVTDSHGGVKELVFPKALDLDRPKRERTTFSSEQLSRLEEEFRLNQYLVGKDRTSLARSLGLSETQVKVWFQNRRTKHKKDREKRVEDVDNQAESQAAQNVLKLLEYKTTFGYNSVLGGATMTNSTNLYEPITISNTFTTPHNITISSCTPPNHNIDMRSFSVCSRNGTPFENSDKQRLIDSKAKHYLQRERVFSSSNNGSMNYTEPLLRHRGCITPILDTTLSGSHSLRAPQNVTGIRHPVDRELEVLYPLGLQNFQVNETGKFTTEITGHGSSQMPVPKGHAENRRFPKEQDILSTTFSSHPDKLAPSSQHFVVQSTKSLGCSELISSATCAPTKHLGALQAVNHPIVYPSLTAPRDYVRFETMMHTFPPTAPFINNRISPGETDASIYACLSEWSS